MTSPPDYATADHHDDGPARGASGPTMPPTIADRCRAYALAAVDAEVAAVASAPIGRRNDRLNKAAFALGSIVGADPEALSEPEATVQLLTAARDAKLPEPEARATIHSGMSAGMASPRDLAQAGNKSGATNAGKQRAKPPAPVPPPGPSRQTPPIEVDSRERARALWEASRPALDTPAGKYLVARGIDGIPPCSLRFHDSTRMPTAGKFPCLIAAVTVPTTGELIAVQRTALKPDGSGKAAIEPDRAALGATSGGAVVLADLDGGDGEIIEGEGIETVMAASRASGLPGIATLSCSTLGKPPLPEGRPVLILVDRGAEAATEAAAKRRHAEGRDVRLARVPDDVRPGIAGTDANDLLQDRGAEAVRAMIETAQFWRPARPAEPTSVTGLPDLTILSPYRFRPPPMPLGGFGRLAPWIEAAARAKGAPLDYVAASALVLAAGLIGTTRRATIQSWGEYPILWLALIGHPSDGKSPGMDAVLDPVRAIEGDDADAHVDALARWEADKHAAAVHAEIWEDEVATAVKNGVPPPPKPLAANAPEKPPRPRIIMADTTTEAWASLLAAQPRGVVMVRDELAGLLGSFDRYSGRGADRAFVLECYGGRPTSVDRQSRPTLAIPFAATSILGGIQPDKLPAITDGADDGFAGRFLYVWPSRVPHARVAIGPDPMPPARAFRRLRMLRHGQKSGRHASIDVPLSPEAVEVFEEYSARAHRLATGEGGIFGSALAKMRGTALRIALAMEMLTWAAGDEDLEPVAISAATMTEAVAWLETYATPMLRRALGEAALPQSERDAAVIARRVARERPTSVNARLIRHQRWLAGSAPSTRYNAALAELVEAHWLIPAPSRAGATSGRHSTDYRLADGLLAALDAANQGGNR